MGGVSSRDHPITIAEDRCSCAYHSAKDLGPLCEGLPLEEGLRLVLGSFTLLKNPKAKNSTPCRDAERSRAPQASSKTNPDWLPDKKPIPKTGTKKNEPTRRRIDHRPTPREKGGLVRAPAASSAG